MSKQNYLFPSLLQQYNFDLQQVEPQWIKLAFARCPFCQTLHSQEINVFDIHSVTFRNVMGVNVLPPEHPLQPACPHLLGIQLFFNFHGEKPHEYEFTHVHFGEVPYITPWFCSDEEGLQGYVVLHGFPMFRKEKITYVPRYTCYTMTYFNESPQVAINKNYQEQSVAYEDDPDFYPATVFMPNIFTKPDREHRILYDLIYWAQIGKLGWIDIDNPAKPLNLYERAKLPDYYRNIRGSTNPITWQRGRWHPNIFEKTLVRGINLLLSPISYLLSVNGV